MNASASSIISAIFTILAVVIGASLSWMRDVWTERSGRERRARYLAIRVVCSLDKYVESCLDVAHDDGLCQGQSNSDGYLEPQVDQPAPPVFPQDLDWSSIEQDLMYRVISLARDAEYSDRLIANAWENATGPDFEPAFETRQEQYAELGLAGSSLAAELREQYKIPGFARRGRDTVSYLKKVRDEIVRMRLERAKKADLSPSII
jgi:hypothetical protein